jgi:transposase
MQKYVLFVGIDISKQWIDVCLCHDGQKKDLPHGRFDNDDKGFHRMLRFVSGHAEKLRLDGGWLFCMEHTGVYSMPLCRFLGEQRLDHVLESALQISRSLGIRRGKSDRADAADIARYACKNHGELRLYRTPSDKLLKIKHLLSLYARLRKARTLLAAPAKEIAAFSGEGLPELLGKASQEAAKHLDGQLKAVAKAILELIEGSEELSKPYGLATSVKGVGPIIGASLLVWTNAFEGFETARQFACYIGIAPFGHSSGTSVKQPDKVSNLANKKLKALISNGALVAIRYDPDLKAYYAKKLKEGKSPFLVQNNVKNKLVQRIFAVVKRGTPYAELGRHRA